MRLNNAVAKFVIVLATIIVTSTAAFVEADIYADGTMSTTSWPEKILTGMTGEDAQKEINDADSSLEVQILPEDSMMTMDFREDRVRIMVDANGIVVNQPQKG